MPPAIFDAWAERFGLELVEVVGSTEALHDFIANTPGTARRGAAGRVVPGFEARVVDDAGAPVADKTIGHLLVKGPTTAPYYWNRLDRTRATMQGEWLRTGDMFARDADGFFHYRGRADDLLKVGGIWVAPQEIEQCLAAHADVADCAVVGYDEDGLQKPRAFVVLREGATADAGALQAHVKATLSPHKYPRDVRFVDVLPRTGSGKVDRRVLREVAV